MSFFIGTTDNDTFVGSPERNHFRMEQGGDDTVTGGDFRDIYRFGSTLTAADTINGGGGSNILFIKGDYSAGLALAPTTFVNINFLVLQGDFDYSLTLDDGNVAAGATMKVITGDGAQTIDAHLESDGILSVASGDGDDDVIGGAGDDLLNLGEGANIANGRDGDDVILTFGDNSTIRGSTGDDLIISNNANDRLHGGQGDDFIHAAPWANGAHVRGGGGYDRAFVAFDGDFTGALTGADMQGVEFVAVDSTEYLLFDIALVLADDFIGGDKEFTLHTTNGFFAPRSVQFDGSAEMDARLVLEGSFGNDVLTGGLLGDTLYGYFGADLLNAGAGNNTFAYYGIEESSGPDIDTIQGFNANKDTIGVTFDLSGVGGKVAGALSSASFEDDLTAALGGLNGHEAVLFNATSGDMTGATFLIIDGDDLAGYTAGAEIVIRLDGAHHLHHLDAGNFINLFA